MMEYLIFIHQRGRYFWILHHMHGNLFKIIFSFFLSTELVPKGRSPPPWKCSGSQGVQVLARLAAEGVYISSWGARPAAPHVPNSEALWFFQWSARKKEASENTDWNSNTDDSFGKYFKAPPMDQVTCRKPEQWARQQWALLQSVDSLPRLQFGDRTPNPRSYPASFRFRKPRQTPGPLHSTHLGRLMVPSPLSSLLPCACAALHREGHLSGWLTHLTYRLKCVPQRGHPFPQSPIISIHNSLFISFGALITTAISLLTYVLIVCLL